MMVCASWADDGAGVEQVKTRAEMTTMRVETQGLQRYTAGLLFDTSVFSKAIARDDLMRSSLVAPAKSV